VDGLDGILPDSPQALRDAGKFLRVKIIAGITKDEGAYYASKYNNHVTGEIILKCP
jgi:carboxylesterase type B